MKDLKKIQTEVENYFRQEPGSCMLKTRKREIVNSRQIAQYFAKELTTESLDVIGKYFGDQDHCMVIYSCRAVKNMIDTDKKYRADIERLKLRMNGLHAKAKYNAYLPRQREFFVKLSEI